MVLRWRERLPLWLFRDVFLQLQRSGFQNVMHDVIDVFSRKQSICTRRSKASQYWMNRWLLPDRDCDSAAPASLGKAAAAVAVCLCKPHRCCHCVNLPLLQLVPAAVLHITLSSCMGPQLEMWYQKPGA